MLNRCRSGSRTFEPKYIATSPSRHDLRQPLESRLSVASFSISPTSFINPFRANAYPVRSEVSFENYYTDDKKEKFFVSQNSHRFVRMTEDDAATLSQELFAATIR